MKIYISSTFSDLIRHRLAVATVLRRMGHQIIGMEDYTAEGSRPLHRCLDDVALCDVYVGIIAWRYGHVATDVVGAPAQVPAGTVLGSLSVTEFEYRKAVAEKKPVLIFLLDPEAEWPSTNFDALTGKGDNGCAIAALRRAVGLEHMINHFRTAEELASMVSAAVYRAEMSRQMNLESLNISMGINIEPFRRNGPVSDSSLMEIKNVIAGLDEVQALQIDIGQGLDWWMTRLYFLASLAHDLTNIETLIFIGANKKFLGIANPTILQERLSKFNPKLHQYEDSLATSGPSNSDLRAEVDRRAGIWTISMPQENINPIFVTSRSLKQWLKPYLMVDAINSAPGDNPALQMQRLFDWPMRFVPVLENGELKRVVDKQALSEQIARMFVREQTSRAFSMTR